MTADAPKNPETNQSGAASPRRQKAAWIVTIVFAVLILIPSMIGFVMKFMELFYLTQGETDGGFAITPVVNYLLASAGFFFLLLWAAINGMFNDLEKPKYLMLETEEQLDRKLKAGHFPAP